MIERPKTSFKFGSEEQCGELLGDGWWEPEQTRIWAKGLRSTLTLPALDKAHTVLELTIGAFVHAEIRPVQRLVIFCNGIEVGSFKSNEGSFPLIICHLSPDMLEDKSNNTIELYHPDHVIPVEVGSPDWRDISICLFSLKIIPTTAPERKKQDGNIFSEMESLGDTCVFGLVQRLSGIEPLGLFRFAGIQLPDLVRALEARFDLVAKAENVRVETKSADKELYVFEDLYRFDYHLFRDATDLDFFAEKKKQIARIRFLVRKLLEDLSQGEKLFVWCSFVESSELEIMKLVRAIRKLGSSTLLWIGKDTTGKLSGHATYVEDGLIRGYVDRIASYPPHVSNIPFDAWETTCTAAFKLWKEKRETMSR